MRIEWLKRCLAVAAVTLVLVLCLFAATSPIQASSFFGAVTTELLAVIRDPTMQWMVTVCTAAYFVTFTVLQQRSTGVGFWHLNNPDLWLAAMVALVTLDYTTEYRTASTSTYALTLLGGAAVGKGFGTWAAIKSRNILAASTGFVLLVLLTVTAAWQTKTGQAFQYRGQGRWTGPWDNPNMFGMLMGVGVVLAVGQLLSLIFVKQQRHLTPALSPNEAEREIRRRNWKAEIWSWIRIILFVAAALICGIGLLKSYSRGAWLGAAFGCGYLAWRKWRTRSVLECGGSTPLFPDAPRRVTQSADQSAHSIARFALPLTGIVLSLGIVVFWNFRHTDRSTARRAFSVANVNDFSWRNRVAAWEGALQMMASKPLLGFGWNQQESVYDKLYLRRAGGSTAIQMNDYFTLGTTLGIPALACFLVYIGLSLSRSPLSVVHSPVPETTDHRPQTIDLLKAVCRAGAIVLLVAFWFDGGLFKLATGSVFWILWELGREDDHG